MGLKKFWKSNSNMVVGITEKRYEIVAFQRMVFLLIVLSASGCVKKDCVWDLTIQNNSVDTVIYSRRMTLGIDPSQCKLVIREILTPGQSVEESITNTCWEDELRFRDFEFYIVHKDSINEGGFYDCDSIYFYNDIIKYYVFEESDIDSLKSVDWTIRYP